MSDEPIGNFDADTFAKILHEQRQRDEQAKRDAKERPHREFIAAAIAVGFPEAQAELLWGWFALKHHEHWDGRIG